MYLKLWEHSMLLKHICSFFFLHFFKIEVLFMNPVTPWELNRRCSIRSSWFYAVALCLWPPTMAMPMNADSILVISWDTHSSMHVDNRGTKGSPQVFLCAGTWKALLASVESWGSTCVRGVTVTVWLMGCPYFLNWGRARAPDPSCLS